MSRPLFIGANTLGETAKGFRIHVYEVYGEIKHHHVKRFAHIREILKGGIDVVQELDNGGVLLASCDQSDKTRPVNKHFPKWRGDLVFIDHSDFVKLRP